MIKNFSNICLIALAAIIFSGCATRAITTPSNIQLVESGYQNKTLAIMPSSGNDDTYLDRLIQSDDSWFLNRWFCGQGEITTLDSPYIYKKRVLPADGTYADMTEVLYNRLRGNNAFEHVIIVESPEEAKAINADFLLVFHVNKCYARGLGANWNIFQWLTYEGKIDMDVEVYDLITNQCLSEQNIISHATGTSTWQTKGMRDYKRRRILKGVTAHNAVSKITF